jgi:ribose transport system permease protein
MTNGLNLFGVSPFMRGVLTGVLLLAAVSLQRRRIVGM